MKVAIVGTSKLTEEERFKVIDKIEDVLKQYQELDNQIELISGGAKGVDSLVKNMGDHHGIAVKEITPDIKQWEDEILEDKTVKKGFKSRNLEIANYCDHLICITVKRGSEEEELCYHHHSPQDHRKTAGCFTAKEAEKLKKPTRLFIV